MPHAVQYRIHLAAAGLLVLAVHVPSVHAQPPRGVEARVVERALRLLPTRPDVPIRVIDPEFAADAEAISRLDAFLVRERNGNVHPVVYLNRRAAMFGNALRGADLDVAILAAVIRHEMAHRPVQTSLKRGASSGTCSSSLSLAGACRCPRECAI